MNQRDNLKQELINIIKGIQCDLFMLKEQVEEKEKDLMTSRGNLGGLEELERREAGDNAETG